MKVTFTKYREWNSSLPESIRASLFHNQVSIMFEELYQPSTKRNEPSFEQLWHWCEANCNSIWSYEKTSYESYKFMFCSSEDHKGFLAAWNVQGV